MTTDTSTPDSRPHSMAKSRTSTGDLPRQRSAVLDGERLDDLPARLKRERLFGRSMILDAADREVEKSGAWLVSHKQRPDAVDRVVSIVEARPAAVFWSCPDREAVLYRHPRKPATVQLPGGEYVYFRHTDPRVIGCLAPSLEASQMEDFFAPAIAVMAFGTVFAPAGLRWSRSRSEDRVMTGDSTRDCGDGDTLDRTGNCPRLSRNATNKAKGMSCAQIVAKMNELTDNEKVGGSGPTGLVQRFLDFKGDDPTHPGNMTGQQASLRSYRQAYGEQGCGDPPTGSEELADRPLPTQQPPQGARSLAVAGGAVTAGDLGYRALRMLPSLAPPLRWSIPANAAAP